MRIGALHERRQGRRPEALALRRDARKLFATLGGLLPSEESLGEGDIFRAT